MKAQQLLGFLLVAGLLIIDIRLSFAARHYQDFVDTFVSAKYSFAAPNAAEALGQDLYAFHRSRCSDDENALTDYSCKVLFLVRKMHKFYVDKETTKYVRRARRDCESGEHLKCEAFLGFFLYAPDVAYKHYLQSDGALSFEGNNGLLVMKDGYYCDEVLIYRLMNIVGGGVLRNCCKHERHRENKRASAYRELIRLEFSTSSGPMLKGVK